MSQSIQTAAAAGLSVQEKLSDTMTVNKRSHSRMAVTRVEEFLRKPPAGFSVEVLASGHRVHSDPERSLVLIDDFDSCRGKVVFQNSLGRWGTTPKHTHTHILTRTIKFHLKLRDLFSATGKLKCTTCGSTPARGRVCCPRGSTCWPLPAKKKTARWPTKRQTRKPEVP